MKHIKYIKEYSNFLRADLSKKIIICDTSCRTRVEEYAKSLPTKNEVHGFDANSAIISRLRSVLSLGYKNVLVVINDTNPQRIEEKIAFIREFVGKGDYTIKKLSELV
jgi:hypothetical protein